MSDARLRQLELAAAQGGPVEQVALIRERERLGLIVPNRKSDRHS